MGNANSKAANNDFCAGVISYSMYLLHPVVIALVATFMGSHVVNVSITSLPLMTAVTIGVTVGLSIISYFLVEKPFILLAVN